MRSYADPEPMNRKDWCDTLFVILLIILFCLIPACQTASQKPDSGQHPPPSEAVGCGELSSPSEAPQIASCVAYGEREDTEMPGVLKAWSRWDTKWGKKELTVRFLNGSPSLQRATWKYFQQWDATLNGLCFRSVSTGPADIRVKFGPGGHWSYVGNECSGVPSQFQTMNLQFAPSQAPTSAAGITDHRRVVLHEIGHAIGLEHEHQHPQHGIPWDREKALRYYMTTQGWTADEVERQVLQKYTGSKFRGTKFDSNSIMQYPVPAELTTNGFSVGWNNVLSPLDIVFAKMMYP